MKFQVLLAIKLEFLGISGFLQPELLQLGIPQMWFGRYCRFDSMCHRMKFGAHTIFCATTLKVVHFELLLVNYSEWKPYKK